MSPYEHLHTRNGEQRRPATGWLDAGWIYAGALFAVLFLVVAFLPVAPEGEAGLEVPAPQHASEDWPGNSASYLAPLAQ